MRGFDGRSVPREEDRGGDTALSMNCQCPSRRALARQLLLFAGTQKFITTSIPPCWQHRTSYSSFTCD